MKRGSQMSLYMMLKCIKQHLSSVHKKVNNNDADLKRRRCLQKKSVYCNIYSPRSCQEPQQKIRA